MCMSIATSKKTLQNSVYFLIVLGALKILDVTFIPSRLKDRSSDLYETPVHFFLLVFALFIGAYLCHVGSNEENTKALLGLRVLAIIGAISYAFDFVYFFRRELIIPALKEAFATVYMILLTIAAYNFYNYLKDQRSMQAHNCPHCRFLTHGQICVNCSNQLHPAYLNPLSNQQLQVNQPYNPQHQINPNPQHPSQLNL